MKRTVCFFLTVLLCLLTASLGAARAATVMMNIGNFAFDPASPTVQVGDTVMWMNSDLTAHTTTSGQPGVPDGNWDSGALTQGQSFSHTFATAGAFPYYCAFHTFM